jgi:hypothetical protein
MKYFQLLFVLLCLHVAEVGAVVVERFTPEELKQWAVYGQGQLSTNHDQLLMSETNGSVGYMLVSPKSYQGDVTFSYDVMALRAATVLVVEMFVSDGDGGSLDFPDAYNGNVKYLFKNFDMYMVAFHNAAHNKPGPFIRKFPKPASTPIVATDKHYLEVGKYSHVEVGRTGEHLWMTIDGKRILDVKDNKPHKEGRMIIRIRGTGHEVASSLIKNVEIRVGK